MALKKKLFPYSGHIEDTKSVEFASVAICSRLTPHFGLKWLDNKCQARLASIFDPDTYIYI